MGWFKRLLGGPQRERPEVPGPMVADLVPGKLRARVYTHDFDAAGRTIPCWTYVTEGFHPLGQKEFVFTVVRGPAADPAKPPLDPLRLFTDFYPLAEQKRYVDVGGFTCFQTKPDGFLGLTGDIALIYTRPEAIPGVEMPLTGRFLTSILCVPGEAPWLPRGGGYRVLARLGRAAQYFPHPPWSDPRRPAVLSEEEIRDSLLGKVTVAHVGGAFLRMALRPTKAAPVDHVVDGGPLGDRLVLRIRRDRQPKVLDVLSKLAPGTDGAFALTFEADPEANVRLAWQPGDTALTTITPMTGNASCLTGGFLTVAFGPGIEDGGRVVEDGFAVYLGPESWASLRHALTTAEPAVIPTKGPDRLALSVEWIGDP